MMNDTYELLDSGNGRKLERFGDLVFDRPCGQAVWLPQCGKRVWKEAHARFVREAEQSWVNKQKLPKEWSVQAAGIKFKLAPTDFGHLGIFPEQKRLWNRMQKLIQSETQTRELNVLNLFAYSGGATLAAAKSGAKVCHLDASQPMVNWARENAKLNACQDHPIRWIVDDVFKFLVREEKRQRFYDGIILDPPSFGRGNQGEVFKIGEGLNDLLKLCRSVLSKEPAFILLSNHTPGYTPIVLRHLLSQVTHGLGGVIEEGEMLLEGGAHVFPVPSGAYALWLR